ncbi:universal stress protein [Anaerobacillus alkaliphilus]|uniref:Universal stress protein n=1 Tax=Anaerobacillus alkaliphilus TaxID=1548597 RepID=A0A4Q0VP34_9BACI|nr:universal stress protein [Anaerobacillus alkaliphilus]RXI96622.1 universal stress protein [Anaerobacillus alkaliphilus]
MFQHILLAADGSPHALRATERAIELVRGSFEAMIEVVYVVNGQTAKSDVLHYGSSDDIKAMRMAKLKNVIEKITSANVKYEIRVIHGETVPTIIDYANKHRFDCVVVGSRKLNQLQKMIVGSVSEKVAKRVKWPVMIVK